MCIGPPGEPAGVDASDSTQHTVRVSWVAGSPNGAPVFAYLVQKYNVDTKEWTLAKNGNR